MNTRKIHRLFALLTALALCLAVLAACTDPKEAKYREAFDLIEEGKYEEAHALFVELGDYKDAAKQAAYFRYLPTGHSVEYVDDVESGTITYTVTLNDKNLPATVVEEYSTGLKHTCTFTYNEFGLVTRRACSDTEGVTTLYEATYDANGNCLHEEITNRDGNVSKYDYTYNEKNQLVGEVFTDNDGENNSHTVTFTYDAEGRETRSVCQYEDETIVEEITYNEAGKILKMTWAEEGSEPYSVYDYYYDDKGRLVEILFTEDGEDGGFRKVTFNDKDQMLTEHVLYTFGFEYTNVFEYDEHGNKIKVTYTNPDGEIGNDVTESTYKLVYLPFEYTEDEWREICDATQCWTSTHM